MCGSRLDYTGRMRAAADLAAIPKDDLRCLVDERARLALSYDEWCGVLRRSRRALAAPGQPAPGPLTVVIPAERRGELSPILMPIWPDGAKALGVGRSTMFRLVAEGQIVTVTCGRKRLVSPHELRIFAASLAGRVVAPEGEPRPDEVDPGEDANPTKRGG